jgi:hypothetical protein
MAEPLPFPLSKPKALALIRAWAADSANVLFIHHARKRMAQRHISPKAVLACLLKGHIVEGPALGIHGDWEVALNHRNAGRILHVACALQVAKRLVIITVYELKD